MTAQFRIDRSSDHVQLDPASRPTFPVAVWIHYPAQRLCPAGKPLYVTVPESALEIEKDWQLNTANRRIQIVVCGCMGEVIE